MRKRMLCFGAVTLFAAMTTHVTKATSVYRCELDGIATFSDRPCAADAVPHQLDAATLNTYAAPPLRTSGRPTAKSRSSKRPNEPPTAGLKQQQVCERLKQRLKGIRSQLRAGYKVAAGERLKGRETRLKAELRSARCG